MKQYIGFDVSLKDTAISIRQDGKRIWRGKCASDPAVIAGRLSEVTGLPASSFPSAVLEQMVRLMRRDLRAGERIVYDEPAQLMALYQRAGGNS